MGPETPPNATNQHCRRSAFVMNGTNDVCAKSITKKYQRRTKARCVPTITNWALKQRPWPFGNTEGFDFHGCTSPNQKHWARQAGWRLREVNM